MHVALGSRVYYKDNGPEDQGTIVDILLDDYPFVVKWDHQKESRFEDRTISLMGEKATFSINPADENIDQFRGDQLGAIGAIGAIE